MSELLGSRKERSANHQQTFYIFATTDSHGKPLDGAKTYRLHVPANVPAKDFWSLK